MADFIFENHYSLWLVRPSTEDARQHLEEHVSEEAQWFGGALAVEPRYVQGLAEGLENHGWSTSL